MARLTPRFSSSRMVGKYVERLYRPAAEALSRRVADGEGELAAESEQWSSQLREGWQSLRFGDVHVTRRDPYWHFDAQVYFGEIEPDGVQVELYADPLNEQERPVRIVMRKEEALLGSVKGYRFLADCPSTRPADHFTPRIVMGRLDSGRNPMP